MEIWCYEDKIKINKKRNEPWVKSLVQCGRTCKKGPSFCLSANSSAMYLSRWSVDLIGEGGSPTGPGGGGWGGNWK
jgi:hypothetical protein